MLLIVRPCHPFRHASTSPCKSAVYDILLGVNAEVSPTARLGSGDPTPTGARFPACCGYSGSRSVREPSKTVWRISCPVWTQYLLAQHPTHRVSSDASHVFGGWRHGPCHRPACPFCHGGQAQVPQGLDLFYRHPLTYTSVDRLSHWSYGFCQDVGFHTPQLSPFSVVTPSSRG